MKHKQLAEQLEYNFSCRRTLHFSQADFLLSLSEFIQNPLHGRALAGHIQNPPVLANAIDSLLRYTDFDAHKHAIAILFFAAPQSERVLGELLRGQDAAGLEKIAHWVEFMISEPDSHFFGAFMDIWERFCALPGVHVLAAHLAKHPALKEAYPLKIPQPEWDASITQELLAAHVTEPLMQDIDRLNKDTFLRYRARNLALLASLTMVTIAGFSTGGHMGMGLFAGGGLLTGVELILGVWMGGDPYFFQSSRVQSHYFETRLQKSQFPKIISRLMADQAIPLAVLARNVVQMLWEARQQMVSLDDVQLYALDQSDLANKFRNEFSTERQKKFGVVIGYAMQLINIVSVQRSPLEAVLFAKALLKEINILSGHVLPELAVPLALPEVLPADKSGVVAADPAVAVLARAVPKKATQ